VKNDFVVSLVVDVEPEIVEISEIDENGFEEFSTACDFVEGFYSV
jgi:hypothetical protein